MNEKQMSNFLNYNIYLTRWKETEVRFTSAKVHKGKHENSHQMDDFFTKIFIHAYVFSAANICKHSVLLSISIYSHLIGLM